MRAHSARIPDRALFTFLPDGAEADPSLTFSMVDARAGVIAANLHAQADPGSRALLLFGAGLDFIVAFFGCLYAGVVAVPVHLPHPTQRARGVLRLAGIAEDAQPAVVLTTSAVRAATEPAVKVIPEFQDAAWLTVDTMVDAPGRGWEPTTPDPEALAVLQYTSGSTGQPKGVMVTHRNITHNIDLIRRSFELDESAVLVGWAPHFHDLGLISMILLPTMMGTHSVMMPPTAFLQRPARWLGAISKYRGTFSAAPNFAYDLCARKVTEEERESIDLSSWAVAVNGSEPIRAESLRRFCDTFAPAGFRPGSMVPSYGLAETTIMVTGVPMGAPRIFRSFDAEALDRGIVRSVPEGSPNARVLVCCGISQDLDVAIVDPQERTRRAPGQIGEIWVAGPSVTAGYWQRRGLSQEVFGATLSDGGDGPFLRTGDLGFQTEEGLFVVGRARDLIIVAGQNHHPPDIEWTAEGAHPAIRPGCVAAFGVAGEDGEVVVVAAELRATGAGIDSAGPAGAGDLEGVAAAVRRAVMQEHRLAVRDVVLLPAGSLPKTPSGKLQRAQARKDYLAGQSPWRRLA
ncbi:hypothetical protein ACG83_23215 [Frankia sp. R43]|nr:hypothetical protein ACG83_23215 [Frankia sp. R43]